MVIKTQTFNGVSKKEFDLHARGVRESIDKYGHAVFYIVRSTDNMNKIYGEDPLSTFNDCYEMTMDLGDLGAYTGGESNNNMFGASFVMQQGLSIERKMFETYTGGRLSKPKVGDILYIPLFSKFFKIKGYDDINEIDYKTHGYDVAYNIYLETFTYSHETISTGNKEVDDNVPTSDSPFVEDGNDSVSDEDIKKEITDDFIDLKWRD